jgi:hypothetical protein
MARKRRLSTNEQITKLNYLSEVADTAAATDDLIKRLGALTIYAGQVDFVAIQAARLIEQMVLKAVLARGEVPSFQPHDDSYFFDNRISTRVILKRIEEKLPFRSDDPQGDEAASRVNELASKFLEAAHIFLNYRNAIIHHVGSPKTTLEDVDGLCDKAILAFRQVWAAHTEFFQAAAPYGFGPKELKAFYSEGQSS